MSFSDMLSLAGCIFGVIGIMLAIVFYLKSRRVKKISFCVKSFGLLSDTTASLKGFTANYGGHSLQRLTAGKILIWNSGTDIIQASDIAASDPIRICLTSKCEILAAIVSASSTPTNNVNVTIMPDIRNELVLTFDYFGQHEGCLISILHTGQESELVVPAGTIKGAGQPSEYSPGKFLSGFDKFFPIGIGVIGGAVFAFLKISHSEIKLWVLISLGLTYASGFSFAGVWFSNKLGRQAGGALDKEFRGDIFPSEFIQLTNPPDNK